MKSEMKPLHGKYYGTIVKITDGFYEGNQMRVWVSSGSGGPDPSIRELESHGVTQEQWDENSQIGNWPIDTPDYCEGEPGAPLLAREALGIYDGHFESRISYEVALGIMKTLETIKEPKQKN